MYEINYEKAKYAFAKKSRIEDPLNGSFELIAKINLDNVVDLSKTLAENHEKFEAYYLKSKSCDALRKMHLVELCKTVTQKHCQIETNAPKEEWSATNFNCIDKIIINRCAINDKQNSRKVYEDALTVEDYKKMDRKLKAKCAFRVDCEKVVITKVEQLEEFIKFARKVGIDEIVFVAEKQLKHINGAPMFFIMRDLLIMQGGHLVINKAISEEKRFFTKLTVSIGGLKVVFKQKITDPKVQAEMWRHFLKHKYIVEI